MVPQHHSCLQALKYLGWRGQPWATWVTHRYRQQVQRAWWTYHYQRAYCTANEVLTFAQDLPEGGILQGGQGCLQGVCQVSWSVACHLSQRLEALLSLD